MRPRSPKRRTIADKLVRTVDRQRKDDIAPVATEGAAGGGEMLAPWASFLDIFTPADGVTDHPVFPAEYTFDSNFLYLRGSLDLGAALDAGTAPTYSIGDTESFFVWNPSPPAAVLAYGSAQTFYGPVALDGGSVNRVAELVLWIPNSGTTLVAGEVLDLVTGVQVSLDGVQLSWRG